MVWERSGVRSELRDAHELSDSTLDINALSIMFAEDNNFSIMQSCLEKSFLNK